MFVPRTRALRVDFTDAKQSCPLIRRRLASPRPLPKDGAGKGGVLEMSGAAGVWWFNRSRNTSRKLGSVSTLG